MKKKVFFKKISKGILVLWFIFCIMPGDCLLLGCSDDELSHCNEEHAVAMFQYGDNSFASHDNSHCSDCCMLCNYNLVLFVIDFPPFTQINLSRRDAFFHKKHFKNIMQAIIFRPPRITA